VAYSIYHGVKFDNTFEQGLKDETNIEYLLKPFKPEIYTETRNKIEKNQSQ